MKHFLIIIIIILAVLKSNAQVTDSRRQMADTIINVDTIANFGKADSIKLTKKDTLKNENKEPYLSNTAFKKRIKTMFGQLATGQSSNTVLSNFADVDIANGKLGFNGTLGFTPSFFGTISASGKTDNNIAQVFDNYKLNTSAAIDLKLSWLLPVSKYYFLAKDSAALNAKKRYYKYKLSTISRKVQLDSLQSVTYIAMLYNQRQVMHDSLNLIRSLLKPGGQEEQHSNVQHKLGEIYYRLIADSLTNKTKSDSTYLTFKTPGRFQDLRKAYEDSINNEIAAAELAAPFSSMHMFWLTPRVSLNKKKFYLYDSLKAYDVQVTDTAFTSIYYGLEFSYYYWRNDNKLSLYINVGGGYVTSNNTDTLTTISVTDTREESQGVQSRSTENKYQAFMGNYEESKYWKLYGNVYFFGADNKWAFHFFPDIQFLKAPVIYNAGLGFVLSFKSKKDEKTIINAEPYIQFKDIGNRVQKLNGKLVSNNTDKSTIGIRIGLPINPPSMKGK